MWKKKKICLSILFLVLTLNTILYAEYSTDTHTYTSSTIKDIEYSFVMTAPVFSRELKFEDEDMKIEFRVSVCKWLSFKIENKTNSMITLDYNLMSYVDINNRANKIFTAANDYKDRDNFKFSITIPPKSNYGQGLIPENKCYYNKITDTFGCWETQLLPQEGPEAFLYKDKSFSIFMPLKIKGVVKEYYFTFKIVDVKYE